MPVYWGIFGGPIFVDFMGIIIIIIIDLIRHTITGAAGNYNNNIIIIKL